VGAEDCYAGLIRIDLAAYKEVIYEDHFLFCYRFLLAVRSIAIKHNSSNASELAANALHATQTLTVVERRSV
jgi:hypothetical protein